jgi:hypothetical protein
MIDQVGEDCHQNGPAGAQLIENQHHIDEVERRITSEELDLLEVVENLSEHAVKVEVDPVEDEDRADHDHEVDVGVVYGFENFLRVALRDGPRDKPSEVGYSVENFSPLQFT